MDMCINVRSFCIVNSLNVVWLFVASLPFYYRVSSFFLLPEVVSCFGVEAITLTQAISDIERLSAGDRLSSRQVTCVVHVFTIYT